MATNQNIRFITQASKEFSDYNRLPVNGHGLRSNVWIALLDGVEIARLIEDRFGWEAINLKGRTLRVPVNAKLADVKLWVIENLEGIN